MEKSYVIYKVTNKINGKIYIGKTYDFEKRKREHILDKNCDIPFHRALKKYGLENFEWEIIDSANSNEEIIRKEIYWIKALNTCVNFKDSNGYNITLGGEGGTSWNSRAVVQFNLDGSYVNEYVSCAHASIETGVARHGINDAANGKAQFAGKYLWKYKDEWNGNNIEPYVKKASVRKVSIMQIDLNGFVVNIFDSVTQASKFTGISRTNISSCLNSSKRTAGGSQWIYTDDYNPTKDYTFKGKRIGKGIYQLDNNRNIIAHYNNCSEAARSIGEDTIVHKQIHSALNSKKKCRGFYWVKVKDYKENTTR